MMEHRRIWSCLALLILIGVDTAAQTPVSSCDTIDSSGTYVLTGDVSANRTCMVIDASDVTFDLMGYTVTFGAGPVVEVENGGFEDGIGSTASDWNSSAAPDANRSDDFPAGRGSWTPHELGSYVMQFAAPTTEQYIYSVPAALEVGREYALSALVYYHDSWSNSSDSLRDNFVVQAEGAGGCKTTASNWPGLTYWSASMCTFTATGNETILRVGVNGTDLAGNVHDLYVDAVELKPAGDYGLEIPATNENVRVTNGSIIQGVAKSYLAYGVYAHQGGDGVELDRLTISVWGPDSYSIRSTTDHTHIHDCVLANLANRSHHSHEGVWHSAAIGFQWASHGRIENNVITRAPSGIGIMRQENFSIVNNTFNVVSNAVHCYAVGAYGTLDIDVVNNTINNTQGSGIFFDSKTRDSIVSGNYVEIRDGPQEERGWRSKGIWARYNISGLTVENNTFRVYGGQDIPRAGVNSSAIGLFIGSNSPDEGTITIRDNDVYVHTNFDSGDWDDDTAAIALDLNTDGASNVTKHIDNNTFESNHRIVTLGHTYGAGNNNDMRGNTFVKSNDSVASFRVIFYGYSGGTNNVIHDTTLVGDANLSDIFFWTYGERDLNVSWALTVNATTLLGTPISGASVWIWDNDSTLSASGVTGADGLFDTDLLEFRIEGVARDYNWTNYTPYRVTVDAAGYNASTTYLDLRESKTLHVPLSAGNETLQVEDLAVGWNLLALTLMA